MRWPPRQRDLWRYLAGNLAEHLRGGAHVVLPDLLMPLYVIYRYGESTSSTGSVDSHQPSPANQHDASGGAGASLSERTA